MQHLIRGLDAVLDEQKILICFPFAGGGASVFNHWEKELGSVIKVCPIQLPGRENRIAEEPYTEVKDVIRDIFDFLQSVNNEIYLFGHSMGAKLAYEMAQKLECEGKIVRLLIVSGSRVPHCPEINPIYHLDDEIFKQELARFEGTPREVLENKELLNFFLPMLRADFTMDETYHADLIKPLQCPIFALGGDEDKEVSIKEITEWRKYTLNTFSHSIFTGGHFFIRSSEKEVVMAIEKKIKDYSN